ncbi:MAG: hypothetical protein IIA55_05020 [Gemmatimonadetes bacterium]|nr:hypothetical protein [Gemmatimonadota bacterium]
MSEAAIKAIFVTLAQASIARIADNGGDDFVNYRGRTRTALHDSQFDQRFTSLPEFLQADLALRELDMFRSRFGESASSRVALQFICELLERGEGSVFDIGAFDTYWVNFWAELENPEWTYNSVANLQNIEANFAALDLGDGIGVRGRNFDELKGSFGWGDFELEAMFQDWMQSSGASSYILLTEHKLPKAPNNLTLVNAQEPSTKASRALFAMRLFKPGDIRVGRTWYTRRAAFNLIDAMSSSGQSQWNPGNPYRLETSDVDSIRDRYLLLGRFQAKFEDKLSNIALALRSFTSVYERALYQGADRVVDSVTALEARLPTNAELTFKLAYRVAGLLATDDDERVTYFNRMKTYYQTRSRIVHGSSLNAKDRELIRNDEPLRSIVRQLLVGFLHLAESTEIPLGKRSATRHVP